MSQDDYIRRRLAVLRPRAKFVATTHSSDFIDSTANLGDGFHYVNLYDEQIDSNIIISPRGLIMIHNTYLSSFAYNLLLCWLLNAESSDKDTTDLNLPLLLKHNFKKYFAEQLLSTHNNIFSRAVFLETLLYEQLYMVPVFKAKSQSSELDRKATRGAQLMSSVLSFHELGHYYLGRDPQIWDEIAKHHSDVIHTLFNHVSNTYPSLFIEEFKCDVISVISCLEQFKAELEREFCIRAIVFTFAVFAVLYSLTKSAKKTALDQKSIPDSVDFKSIEKRQINYEYSIGIDLDFLERAKLITELCIKIAEKEKIALFGEGGAFPLSAAILNDLLLYVEKVMESDDQNSREMSLLVAEALHEHPRGIEFLNLRSKTFAFGNQRNSDGTLQNTNVSNSVII